MDRMRRNRRPGRINSGTVCVSAWFRLQLLMVALLAALLLPAAPVIATTTTSSSCTPPPATPPPSNKRRRNNVIVVVGSVNADTFLPVSRLPVEGENLTLLPDTEPVVDVPGGKGATQAVAASRLLLLQRQQQSSDDVTGDAGPPPISSEATTATGVAFVGQFGRADDPASTILRKALAVDNSVDLSYSRHHPDLLCGRGYVFHSVPSGQVSAIVSGGANRDGWSTWQQAWDAYSTASSSSAGSSYDTTTHDNNDDQDDVSMDGLLDEILGGCQCLLLQREVPEYVNLLIASYAKRQNSNNSNSKNNDNNRNIVVLQDVGGEDRPMSRQMMRWCDYLVPNESELRRLVRSTRTPLVSETSDGDNDDDASDNDHVHDETDDDTTNGHDDDDETIVRMARILQERGARNVLVTRGRRGSTLVLEPSERGSSSSSSSSPVIHCPAYEVTSVVDETGAGDCYRAAFAVALLEHGVHAAADGDDDAEETGDKRRQQQQVAKEALLRRCMEFASVAASLSVERHGAVPSAPTRGQVEERYRAFIERGRDNDMNDSATSSPTAAGAKKSHQQRKHHPEDAVLKIPRGDGLIRGGGTDRGKEDEEEFPFLIGSRLNSMKDRPELWNANLDNPRDYVRRQATVKGLTCVDFNYPQHFHTWTSREAKAALDEAGLVAGAVCLRYPAKFARGAMNHPDSALRQEAIDLTMAAAQTATDLGCSEVVVWSAFDGYDYPFQVDYDTKWRELVKAFRAVCDAYPDMKFSVEYKPTDENTRFFTVPTTGAALLLVNEVDRKNFGLTLDVGHMLMAGENPGQSIAMVGRARKLFGIQLNDGYTRLAAEDGLMFGSVHPPMALEIMYQLRRTGFAGHLYFDSFPQRSDPVKEAEYNIRQVKSYWAAAGQLDAGDLRRVMAEHDAIGALELVSRALQQVFEQ